MRRKLLLLVTTVTILAACFSCGVDPKEKPITTKIESDLETGSWEVTYFLDDQDETAHFAGFIFTFNDDGTVVAAKDAMAVNGTWSVTSTRSATAKLILNFEVIDPFDEFNDDWDVIEFNPGSIELRDVSGGSGDTDYLTFTKVQ